MSILMFLMKNKNYPSIWFDLWLRVLVNSHGHVGMPQFYGTLTQHYDDTQVTTKPICMDVLT